MGNLNNNLSKELKTRIGILSQLANVDGELESRELAFIYTICIRNNIEVGSIASLISNPEPVISLKDLTQEQQESYLVDVLSLMMIDGKVLPAEINYAAEMGERLGFDREALLEFIDELMFETTVGDEYIRHRVSLLPRL